MLLFGLLLRKSILTHFQCIIYDTVGIRRKLHRPYRIRYKLQLPRDTSCYNFFFSAPRVKDVIACMPSGDDSDIGELTDDDEYIPDSAPRLATDNIDTSDQSSEDDVGSSHLWGIKLLARAGSSGFLYQFDAYQGQPTINYPHRLGSDVTLKMRQALPENRGPKVAADNYFSLDLAAELSKRGLGFVLNTEKQQTEGLQSPDSNPKVT